MEEKLKKNTLPFVSIVIPNYNGGPFLMNLIDSILHLEYPADRYEVIIINNNSSDGSLEALKSRYPSFIADNKIKLIESTVNAGAPAAYNMGINKADKAYDYILKLDSDMVLTRDCLMELIKCGGSGPKIGFVGGKVFYYSDKTKLHLIGSRLSPFYSGGIGIGKCKSASSLYDKDREIDVVNGCMMLVKRAVIDEAGLMDENYFLYFDDLDWTLRAMRKGYKSIYCSKALAYHNTSEPYKRFQNKKWIHYAVYNGFYFMKKNYKGIDRAIFLISMHIRILAYFYGIMRNNTFFKQIELVKALALAYCGGLKYLWKRG